MGGPVTVKGKGWRSGLGLLCRAIEATVGTCQLDMGRVLQDQKLTLITPATGTAMVALNEEDFGNFITHPLVEPPSPISLSDNNENDNRIQFIKDDVRIDPKNGLVTFHGLHQNEKWTFTLRRGDIGPKKAIITARPTLSSSLLSEQQQQQTSIMTKVISNFFNNMTLELDGTFLNFDDMMITNKGKSGGSIMFALNIKVKKFPSPGLEF